MEAVEVLQRGYADELQSAFQYMALAGRYEDMALQRDFLRYASEELLHAQKLLDLLEQRQAGTGPVTIAAEPVDDLYLHLVEYMAREAGAIFYYEALETLVEEPEVQLLCQEIRREEEQHLTQITALFRRIKESGYGG